jgi:hypothetical protein
VVHSDFTPQFLTGDCLTQSEASEKIVEQRCCPSVDAVDTPEQQSDFTWVGQWKTACKLDS